MSIKLFESLNKFVESKYGIKESIDYSRKSIEESFDDAISEAMSAEDEKDTELLKGIYKKIEGKKLNLKNLSQEERDVLNKYNLDVWGFKGDNKLVTKDGAKDVIKNSEISKKYSWRSNGSFPDYDNEESKFNNVNYADRARKIDGREYAQSINNRKYYKSDTFEKVEREEDARRMGDKVGQMKRAISDKNYAKDQLDSLEDRYQKGISDADKAFLADVDKAKQDLDWSTNYNTRQKTAAEEKIKALLNKHRKNEALYAGVDGVEFIDHGDWADPELEYNNIRFNYWEVENEMWNEFLEENSKWTDADADNKECEDEFINFLKSNLTDYLDSIMPEELQEAKSSNWDKIAKKLGMEEAYRPAEDVPESELPEEGHEYVATLDEYGDRAFCSELDELGFYQSEVVVESDEEQEKLKDLGINPGDKFILKVRYVDDPYEYGEYVPFALDIVRKLDESLKEDRDNYNLFYIAYEDNYGNDAAYIIKAKSKEEATDRFIELDLGKLTNIESTSREELDNMQDEVEMGFVKLNKSLNESSLEVSPKVKANLLLDQILDALEMNDEQKAKELEKEVEEFLSKYRNKISDTIADDLWRGIDEFNYQFGWDEELDESLKESSNWEKIAKKLGIEESLEESRTKVIKSDFDDYEWGINEISYGNGNNFDSFYPNNVNYVDDAVLAGEIAYPGIYDGEEYTDYYAWILSSFGDELESKEFDDVEDARLWVEERIKYRLDNELFESLDEAMSEEDRRDTDLIISAYKKLLNRSNAKLEPEEKEVFDKYNLRFVDGRVYDKNRDVILSKQDLESDYDWKTHKYEEPKANLKNYADAARKSDDRQYAREVRRTTYERDFDKAERELDSKNMSSDVEDMKYALYNRNDADKSLEKAKSRYNNDILKAVKNRVKRVDDLNAWKETAKEDNERRLEKAKERMADLLKKNESLHDDNYRTIHTGLKGKINHDILESVMGQMSDGMWENSPGYEKYWMTAEISPDNDILVDSRREIHDYGNRWISNGYYDKSEDEVKKFFANKIKTIAQQYLHDNNMNPYTNWSEDCDEECSYLSYNEDVTIADAFRAYKELK